MQQVREEHVKDVPRNAELPILRSELGRLQHQEAEEEDSLRSCESLNIQ